PIVRNRPSRGAFAGGRKSRGPKGLRRGRTRSPVAGRGFPRSGGDSGRWRIPAALSVSEESASVANRTRVAGADSGRRSQSRPSLVNGTVRLGQSYQKFRDQKHFAAL